MRLFMIPMAVAIGGLAVAPAVQGQSDSSAWSQWRANTAKTGSAVADGPALTHDWTRDDVDIVAPGGFSVGSNGDIYYKSMDDDGTWVYRIDPADGSTVAKSINLGGVVGSYSGVAVGVEQLYTTVYVAEGDTSIIVLDKNTLDVLGTISHPEFLGLRGTPVISEVPNQFGNYTLYVVDRNGIQMHAVDATTGDLLWSYDLPADVSFGQLGPLWLDGNNRQVVAHFCNAQNFGGVAIADNGDGTYEELWVGGPDSFNWWGSGALSADGLRIYVTTFNDGDVPPLWAIDVEDGSIVWDVPGYRDDPDREMNFFARPAVVDDRVYCGGGRGVVACYQDLGGRAELMWDYRDQEDEYTCLSAVKAQDGNTYIYAVRQGLIQIPNRGTLVVLRDDGDTYTKLLETDLDGLMLPTLYSNSSCTIDDAGNLYIGGGNSFDEGVNPGGIYKFTPDVTGLALTTVGTCPGDMRFKADGATANEKVAFIYAEGTGSVSIPSGNPCVGTMLGLNGTAKLAGVVNADATGLAKFDTRVPSKACGRIYMQALDLTTCGTSNVVLIE